MKLRAGLFGGTRLPPSFSVGCRPRLRSPTACTWIGPTVVAGPRRDKEKKHALAARIRRARSTGREELWRLAFPVLGLQARVRAGNRLCSHLAFRIAQSPASAKSALMSPPRRKSGATAYAPERPRKGNDHAVSKRAAEALNPHRMIAPWRIKSSVMPSRVDRIDQ